MSEILNKIKTDRVEKDFIDTLKVLNRHHGEFYTSFHKFHNNELIKFYVIEFMSKSFVIYLSEIKTIESYSCLSDDFTQKALSKYNVFNFKVIVK